MKRSFCSIALLVMLCANAVGAQEAVKIVYFDNYPPFSWNDEQDGMRGILIDILNEALQTRMGYTLSHEGYPWARAQYMVKIGKADAFVTIPTPQRKEYVEISHESVFTYQITMFTSLKHARLEELKKVKTLDDLRDFTILDHIGNGWGEKHLSDLNREVTSHIDNALLKLAHGRGDVFLQNPEVAFYIIKKLGLEEQIIEIPTAMATNQFHLCFGKHSSYVGLLPEFDKTLKAMKEDGTLQKIFEHYR